MRQVFQSGSVGQPPTRWRKRAQRCTIVFASRCVPFIRLDRIVRFRKNRKALLLTSCVQVVSNRHVLKAELAQTYPSRLFNHPSCGRLQLADEDGDFSTVRMLTSVLPLYTQPRRQFSPWPVSDVPWGPNGFFFEMGATLYNQEGPVIVTWGGFKQLVLETKVDLLTMVQVFDADGFEIESKVRRLVGGRED